MRKEVSFVLLGFRQLIWQACFVQAGGMCFAESFQEMVNHERLISLRFMHLMHVIVTTKTKYCLGGLSVCPRNQDISSEKKKCPFFVPKIRCRQEEHDA